MSAHSLPPAVALLGARGAGKSTLLAALMAVWQKDHDVWVIDPCREHAPPLSGRRVRLPLALWARTDSDTQEAGKAMWRETVDEQARAAWLRTTTRDVVVVLDDANACVLKGQQGPEAFTTCVVHEGRHRGIGFAVACRRPSEIPRDWTANAAHRFVFYLDEPRDLSYAASLGHGLAPNAVAALKRGQFFHKGPGHGWHRHDGVIDADGRLFPCLLTK